MGGAKSIRRIQTLNSRAASHKSTASDSIDHATALIDYLQAIPEAPRRGGGSHDGNHEIREPPTKRARTGHQLGSIAIMRRELSFSAHSATRSLNPTLICRRGVGNHLKLEIIDLQSVDPQKPQYRLQIAPRTPLKGHAFCVSHPLDLTALSETLITALHVAQVQGFDPERDGCLWASTDIDVKHDCTQVHIKLTIEVYWDETQNVFSVPRTKSQQLLRDEVLRTCFPDLDYPPQSLAQDWTPQDFYEAAHVPDKDAFDTGLLQAEIPNLTAELFPFQRRSIQWLLNREGVSWAKATDNDESCVRPLDLGDNQSSDKPISFVEAQDMLGQPFYVSTLFGVVARDISRYLALQSIKGGILAEEMGLGKTLEVIGLLLLHRRPEEPHLVYDRFLGRQLRPTRATLVITPSPLLDQWQSELARHAPHLKVAYYPGLKASAKENQAEEDLIEELGNQDVVLTTYEALRPEVHMALEPPARSMRGERKYDRPKSPLVQLSWWRVCIDEAQMVENWTTNTATLARLIPRVNVWAITGTPVKDDIQKDLRGLLAFLRLEPYASDTRIYTALFKLDKGLFRRLFSLISLRHTKGLVRDEIALPPQKRYVITMPFSAVEEQHYQSLFKDLTKACGLDTLGNPIQDGWDPDNPAVQEAMRVALDRLRQTVLHPEVGVHNQRALGHRAGPMRTVAEVLDAMLDQSEAAIQVDQRSLLQIRLTRGQVLAGLKQVQAALTVWEDVLETSADLVSECRAQLEQEIKKTTSRGTNASESDTEDDDDGKEATRGRISEARRRLRYALEIQHKAVFFCADAYYTIKSNQDETVPESDEFKRLEKKETESYDSAKLIRKEILQESHSRAKRLMDRIANAATDQAFAVIPEFRSMDQKGIESRSIVDAFDELCGALDDQANQLDEWREHVVQLLLKPLLDEEGDEITGEEYEESTKLQDEIEVYVRVLRTAVADRQDALTGQKNALVDVDYKVAIRQAEAGEGPFPEKLLQLFAIRDRLNPQPTQGDALGSLRGVISALRALAVKLRHDASSGNHRARTEHQIVMNQLQLAQKQMTEQIKVANVMSQEIQCFSDTMNARLDFYRQLQALSDTVVGYEGDKTDESLAALTRQEDDARQALASAESKHRYLMHLKDAESGAEEQRLCIICQSTFSIGVLTICGHQFCKECITLWFQAHRNCPVCKRHLQRANLHDITLKPKELKVQPDASGMHRVGDSSADTSPSKRSGIYTEFNPEKLAEINNIDLEGPNFTTKVDTLVRHLLWLRDSDPGAKSIVFSQYKDFLDVLALAFQRYRIGYTAFDKANGTSNFKHDPGIEVFLLHARAHSSGLNLVNASHVFLCEPLLNTALELQAIARVDRIGQGQETTVWLYIVDGTVEESIYNLSVQRRMEHIGKSLRGKSKESTPELPDAKLDVANSLELEQAHFSKLMGRGGISGEAVDKSDLWTCLFGHVKEPKRQHQDDELIRNNPAIRGLLTAEAAERRADPSESVDAYIPTSEEEYRI